jgi:low affinity Fe/Cu permease
VSGVLIIVFVAVCTVSTLLFVEEAFKEIHQKLDEILRRLP